jgi:hypothetical protein
MKRNFIFAIVLSATTSTLLAQTSNTAKNLVRTSSTIEGNDKTGNVAMIGDSEIASEIGMSFEDRLISGVHWKVAEQIARSLLLISIDEKNGG